ncbi:hypothetical protein NV391_09105 [Companilactobacillus crustorum]|uniref:phage tail assembly chaperone n=1 Tax=Companilactobacillus crustorum TaxID=392416 RepID=UPI00237E2E0A|nr:hypothetical protein [Companilactobacillus crustorum]WDT65116.1 hypothetical protein NV391_09105 [Companilactobacillus crustorum]
MADVKDFLMENVDAKPETREVKFPRFKAPFVIKSITEDENSVLQKQATTKTKDRQTRQITSTVDQSKYVDLLAAACVVSPELDNADLQKSWNSIADPVGLLKKMLKVGEYAELLNQIQDLCGFDLEDVDDLREEVKN